jgi:serine phosphatase RsbU (regulator of sigma subunit)
MDRGASAEPLTWLVLPAGAILLASALTLSRQPYTGLTLRGDEVMAVVSGSPGDLAGLSPGDRLTAEGAKAGSLQGPLAAAYPGVPLQLIRQAPEPGPVRIVPHRLPASERRMLAALFAVASGFVLLGGWVWSERRDRLTRPFYLLCLAFAALLAPPPRLPWPAASTVHELLYTAATLALPALCVHFFALFPEPPTPRGRLVASVTAAYGVAGLLYAGWASALVLSQFGWVLPAPVLSLLQAAAAVWFAAGLLLALVLFARSYSRAGTVDARRRLRVALLGTTLGLGPLAALTVWRNLAPGVAIPGERAAVLLTLLVPLSFTWATVIHRVFDFRVALRAAVAAAVLAIASGAVYVTGELATVLNPEGGVDYGGIALALVGLATTLAGPSRPWVSAFARALLPLREERPLSEVLSVDVFGRGTTREEVLKRATAVLAAQLKLDRCLALEVHPGGSRLWGLEREDRPRRWPHGPRVLSAIAGRSGPVAIGEVALVGHEREALLALDVHWLLPVGEEQVDVALLLGRRLAGPWLDRREVETLSRFARHVSLGLEHSELRSVARTHGQIDRELAIAGAIQSHLLPRRAPVYPTLDCAAATLSSEPVGGDYYDFAERSERELTLVVGDAAGKGVPAALRLASVRGRFRTEALRGQDPGLLLSALNLELAQHQHPENFVALVCARIDVRAGSVLLSNAGLEPPLLRRRSGNWEAMTASGVLLGVQPEASYPDARADLGAGDLVMIYTDGLTEARREDELFGLERVREVVDRNAHRRAADIVQSLIDAARAFSDLPLDDLTVVVLKQLADPPGATSRRKKTHSRGMEWRPMAFDETTEAVFPARAANPRAADPKG